MVSKKTLKSIVRFLSDECTLVEKRQIEKKMQNDPEFKALVNSYQSIWNVKEEPITVENMDDEWRKMKTLMDLNAQDRVPHNSDILWPRIKNWLSNIVPIPAPRFAYSIAMIVLLVAAGSYLYMNRNLFHKSEINQLANWESIKVEYGKRATVTLQDGTLVTLDAGSELKFPKVFDTNREIILNGEAYLEVAKDAARPFIVHANQAVVQVVGTRFNVRAWEELPDVTVTVTEGKVILSNRDTTLSQPIFLTKNMQGKVLNSGKVLTPKNVNAKDFLTWMEHEILFERATVNDVLSQLERWYDFNFELSDSSIVNQEVTVHIQKTTVDDVLQLLGILTESKVVREDKNIKFIKN